MVSLDDPERNRAFAESLDADLVLLSDPGGSVAKAYGVSALGGLVARRWTFYIDRDGVIRHIDKKVRVRSAGQDIARTLEALGFPKRGGPPGKTDTPAVPAEPASPAEPAEPAPSQPAR